MEVSKIFLPLRSNTGWFSNSETQRQLERQLKTFVMLFDRLYVQDGRFILNVWSNGHLHYWTAPHRIHADRGQVTYYEEGSSATFEVEGHAIFDGPTILSRNVDFFPILHAARMDEMDYVTWWNFDASDSTKSTSSTNARAALNDSTIRDAIPGNDFVRDVAAQALFTDALMATDLKMPFVVDAGLQPLIDALRKREISKLDVAIPGILYHTWIDLNLPDFSVCSWEEIRRLRESPAGEDFRTMVKSIAAKVQAALPELNQSDIEHLVQREFSLELIDELKSRIVTPGSACVSFGTNFLSVGAVQPFVQLGFDQASWISLLRYKPR